MRAASKSFSQDWGLAFSASFASIHAPRANPLPTASRRGSRGADRQSRRAQTRFPGTRSRAAPG
eukprot:1491331-Prymnesium_polylepis.1